MSGLTDQFQREMRRGAQRIESTIAPFARFVKAEREKIGALQDQLTQLDQEITAIKGQLE
jgi:TolA-binding protein